VNKVALNGGIIVIVNQSEINLNIPVLALISEKDKNAELI